MGCIEKSEQGSNIVQAIRNAYYDSSQLSPMITKKLRGEFQRCREVEQNINTLAKMISLLTPAEMTVLRMIRDGYSRKEIADARFVVPETIKKQTHLILKKTGFHSIREALNELGRLGFFDIFQ